jgi:Putative zinc-finger
MSQQHSSKQICQSQNVQAYFDNELDAALYSLMREHVADCRVCKAELRSLGHLHALMGLAFGFTSDLTVALQRYSLASH